MKKITLVPETSFVGSLEQQAVRHHNRMMLAQQSPDVQGMLVSLDVLYKIEDAEQVVQEMQVAIGDMKLNLLFAQSEANQLYDQLLRDWHALEQEILQRPQEPAPIYGWSAHFPEHCWIL